MKRILLALLITALTLPGCSSRADCARADVFCAGLVTGFGQINDRGLNQSAWEGLVQAKQAGLLDQITYIETIDSKDRAANITALAKSGYDLVVTVGASMAEATAAAAEAHPRTLFIGVDQEQEIVRTNFAGLVFHEDQGGFLAGALAASMTKTRRVAAICEAAWIQSMRRYCEGFRAGVRYFSPDVFI